MHLYSRKPEDEVGMMQALRLLVFLGADLPETVF